MFGTARVFLSRLQRDARLAVPRLIDVHHRGVERVIGAWEVRGLVVDPGPEPCIETLLAGLDGRPPTALLLTHIHLDHAGAAGALVRRFEDLPVYVHARGAAHLADPSKLIASAGRLYGDEMDPLWGEIVPVPERNLRVLEGGRRSRACASRTRRATPATTSPTSTPRAATRSSATSAGCGSPRASSFRRRRRPRSTSRPGARASTRSPPGRRAASASPISARSRSPRRTSPRSARSSSGSRERARGGDREAFLAALEAEIDERADEDDRDRLRLAVPPEHVWLGLERYWEKRGVLEG